MRGIWTDLTYASRRLAAAPGFTLAILLLLSVGIGANAVFFHAFDALLLKTLPVAHPEQLVRLVTNQPVIGTRSMFPYGIYPFIREHDKTAEAVVAYLDEVTTAQFAGRFEAVRAQFVSDNYFTVLGAPPLYGHTPATREDDAVVLSYRFWRNSLGANPAVIGRKILLNEHPFVVAAVMPDSFNGTYADTSQDVRIPLASAPALTGGKLADLNVEIVARLRPGVMLKAAEQEMLALRRSAIETEVEPGWRDDERRTPAYLESIATGVSLLRNQFARALSFLMAAVALLLLLVCANVAGLMLARSALRKQEFAVRLAVGASRGRLVRLLLAESFVLTALGAAGSAAVAWVSTPLLVHAIPPVRTFDAYPNAVTIGATPDFRVVAFGLLVCAATMLLFGLVPAWQSTRVDLHNVLKSARATGRWRTRRLLVALQVALCTILLAGAALFANTLRKFETLNPGFDREHVVTFTTDSALAGYTAEQTRLLHSRLLNEVRSLPGVTQAGLSLRGVMRNFGVKTTALATGQKRSAADFMNTSINGVTPSYFDTMGMRLLAGRTYTQAEFADQKPSSLMDRKPGPARNEQPVPMVVNQAFVRKVLGPGDPIGRRFATGVRPEEVAGVGMVIIGVVSDAHYRSLREPVPPTLFPPLRPEQAGFVLNVRTNANPALLIEPVRRLLHAIDPRLPLTEVHTLSEEVETSLWRERLLAVLATLFAVAAGLLAASGIYGLLAHAIVERTPEIGIRMALGARPSQIAGWTARQCATLVGSGLLLGVVAARLLVPFAADLLYENRTGAALGLAAILIVVVALAATAIPAIRASRVQPAGALRGE